VYLSPVGPELAEALGDTPETTIAHHQAVRGLARVAVAGRLPEFDAAVVQALADPTEPIAFGHDAAALWGLLRDLEGWECVCAPSALAEELGRLIVAERGGSVRYYGDVQYALHQPVAVFEHPWVRQLTPDDLALLAAAPRIVRGGGWATPLEMVEAGAAGAIVDGQLVAIAHVSAQTPRHADIGVATLEPYRRQGLSTAAASLVARVVQAGGRVAVWSTGEDNWASQAVARKLGFAEVGRKSYVIPRRRP
jgi:RimJ/RimL family protein N-acetyltransferase